MPKILTRRTFHCSKKWLVQFVYREKNTARRSEKAPFKTQMGRRVDALSVRR